LGSPRESVSFATCSTGEATFSREGVEAKGSSSTIRFDPDGRTIWEVAAFLVELEAGGAGDEYID